jgi:hypothetical protein
METVKIKDIKTGAIKVVKKSLASDYIGTGKFILVDEKKEEKPKYNYRREDREDA